MRWSFQLLCRLLIPAVCVMLGFALMGCNDDNENVEPTALVGPFSGVMTSDTGATIGTINGTVLTDGNKQVRMTITTATGESTITSGAITNTAFSGTGTINGETVVFTGTFTDDFSSASGTWTNQTTNATGTWTLNLRGVTSVNIPGIYSGTVTATGITDGTVTFNIDGSGRITGALSRTGFGGTLLTGSVNLDNQIIMTGTESGGTPVFMSGTLSDIATTPTVTDGTITFGFSTGAVTGTWTATKNTI